MFYLSKLGNLLDEIDGGSGEKEGDATEPKEGGQGQGTLANSLGGLLTSASLAAGSVASSSTSVAKAQFGAITSLLGEDEDEPEEQVPDKAQSSRATEPPIPDADGHRTDQDVAASAVPARAQLPDEVPEASPAPSATSELVAGWSFEEVADVPRHPAAVTAVEPEVVDEVHFDHPSTLRSPTESGATLTTQGSLATSEEYHRVEEAVEEVAPAPEIQQARQTEPALHTEHIEVLETSEPRLESLENPEADLQADPQLAQDWLTPAEHQLAPPVEELIPVESTRQPADAQEPRLEPAEQSNGHGSEAVEVFEAMPEPAVHANGGPDHGGQPDELPEEAGTGTLPDANGREEAPPLQFESQRVEQHSEPSEVVQLRADYEARLMGAVQQIAHLQARIEELESESAVAKDVELQLSEKMGCMTMQLTEAQAARQQAEAASAQLQREADQLRQEASAASERARAQATEASDAALGQVREEMERELEHLLKQKDEQLRAIESKLAASERSRQNATRDLEALTHEADALKQELEQLHSDSAGRTSDHERSVEQLTADYQKQIAELEERRDIEERQKHELALNLRSVEERSRSEIAQLEAQKTQLELQSGALQVQLQEEQQKCVDLSVSLGEAQQRLAHAEESQGAGSEEALRAGELKARELSERALRAEEKLLEAQSVRDMFAKETDMYRSELKVTRDEKIALEEELKKSQDRLRELSASARQGAGQEAVLEAVQKDFESRMERYRDEVQYLRQKCDEKEKRCEQLMAEKGALSVELRSASWGAEAVPSAVEDIEAGTAKTGAAAKAAPSRLMRSLPLAAPSWLRSADEPLKLVLQTLNTVPAARLTFFTYVILLHAWVLFILQQMALHPSSS